MVDFECPKCGAVLSVGVKEGSAERSVGDVIKLFSSDLEGMLTFEESKGFIVVRPRRFLGSDSFAKVAAVVRSANGEYVSAGKESHFKVPVKA